MDLFFSLNIGVIGGADGPTAIFVSGGPMLAGVMGKRKVSYSSVSEAVSVNTWCSNCGRSFMMSSSLLTTMELLGISL